MSGLNLMSQDDSTFKLHAPTPDNLFDVYRCGLRAGQVVALRKPLAIHDHKGKPTGKVYPAGEQWLVLVGKKSDPVLWFRRPDGERHTWPDEADAVEEWFEVVRETTGDAGNTAN